MMSHEWFKELIKKLQPLQKVLGIPQPGEWLFQHSEPGQSFEEYSQSNPITPQGKRSKIFIQPMGEFQGKQRQIIEITADFMSIYFKLPVTINPTLPLSIIPYGAQRVHPQWGMLQVLSPFIMDRILIPQMPEAAAVFIAFTSFDLWPGMGWNFVFGQASTRDRVGVWSIYRYGNPSDSPEEFQRCLLRTMKTAVHETGHMFSLLHCTCYQCVMCGSNHQEESDRRPITLCSICLAKICWALKIDPIERYRKLIDFYQRHYFKNEAKRCQELLNFMV